MVEAAADREWMRGYEAARRLCLTHGAPAARDRKPVGGDAAYESGYDWGLWDHEDANGLPHHSGRGA